MSKKEKTQVKHAHLTALSPIEHRANDPDGRVATIRATLDEQSKLRPHDQIFRECPMVHMARLHIIDDVLPSMGAEPPDRLKCKYLLLCADIDGEVDDFLDALYNGPQWPFDWAKADADSARHSNFVRNVWGQCIGYPKATGAVFFRQYIYRCRINTTLPYASYKHSVSEITQAKTTQAAFADFATRVQGMNADDLFASWQQYRDSAPQPVRSQSVSPGLEPDTSSDFDYVLTGGAQDRQRQTAEPPSTTGS